MKSKLRIPFSTCLNAEDQEALNKYLEDESVQSVTVLPSFKLKKNRLRNGMRIIRCDDVVIQAKRTAPKYSEYQIGCGFLFLKFRCNASIEEIQQALPKIIQELAKGPLPTNQGDNASSMEFKSICAGPEHFISKLKRPVSITHTTETFPQNSCVDENEARSLISEEWTQSLKGHFDCPNFLKLTGSHYLDILRAEGGPENEFYINIHACGLQFSDITNSETNERIKSDTLNNREFSVLTNVMKNYATTRRLVLVNELLHCLSEQFDGVSVELISDLTHHDSTQCPDGSYLIYNDSQPLIDGVTSILPSGFANFPSYSVGAGKRADEVARGLSHNLKPIIKNDDARKPCESQVSITEATIPSFLKKLCGIGITIQTKKITMAASPAADRLVKLLKERGILSHSEMLLPLFRLRIRRPREKPFQRSFPKK